MHSAIAYLWIVLNSVERKLVDENYQKVHLTQSTVVSVGRQQSYESHTSATTACVKPTAAAQIFALLGGRANTHLHLSTGTAMN